MSHQVQLPALGESVTEGTVTRWLKSVGDRVEVDEALLEISTDKVDTEIPAPVAGILLQILVDEDETAEVGSVLAVIGEEGANAQPAQAPSQTVPQAPPAPPVAPPAPAAPATPPPPAAPSVATGQVPVVTASSATDVLLPALGESVNEGTVTRWLKSVGDTVELDEALLEISTDKVDTEIPAPAAGTLLQILVAEDEIAEVGAVLARIGAAGAQASRAAAPAPSAPPATPTAPAQVPQPQQVPPAAQQAPAGPAAPHQADPGQHFAAGPGATGGYLTPLVRRLASQHGIDPRSLTGTGVGGRIRKEDVLAAAAAAAPRATARPARAAAPAEPLPVSPLRGTTEKASRLRKIIAERMVDALHTQAQLTTVVEVDVTRIAALRSNAKKTVADRDGVRLTFLPFFVQAAVEALRAYPKVNGLLADDQITYPATENVGIAVDTERGLVVPVLRDAGDLGLIGIARGIADLAERTRANKVSPDELSGATFTVTNTGSAGALIDTPIVPGGTSAILATGAIVRRPVVVETDDGSEAVAIRSMCYLSLSYDHRLVDGADAARYLRSVKARIEEGAFESDLGV